MTILRVDIGLEERQNAFFNKMANILPPEVYNSGTEFMVPRLSTVPINGTVVPLSVVKVFVNGLDQSPVPDIVADEDGNWSYTITLAAGQNTIQVQFFPPEITQHLDNGYVPVIASEMPIDHVTLFSRFSTENSVYTVLLDGTKLYIGTYIPPISGTKTLYRYEIMDGTSVALDLTATTPTSGRVYAMALDSNWLYVAQELSGPLVRLSRYAKNLSARLDNTGYATVPGALYADGVNLFVARDDSGNNVKVSKVDVSTMALIGSEVDTKEGTVLGEFTFSNNQIAEDGSGNIILPGTYYQFGDQIGDQIEDGSPSMGAALTQVHNIFLRKLKKSDMSNQGLWRLLSTTSTSPFVSPNSLVGFGGYYYTLAQSNPAKVIKLQEQVIDTLNYLVPIEATPLPVDAVDASVPLVSRMRLGPDSRLYVASNGDMARFTPGSMFSETIARGTVGIDATLSYVAVVDDTMPTAAIAAPIGIFADRAVTFNVPAPAVPTNVSCHWNVTRGAASVQWDQITDGSGVIVEMSVDGQPGGFIEVGREYFGDSIFITGAMQAAIFPTWTKVVGDTMHFRVKAANVAGQSGYSNTATVSIPFTQPPISDQSSLVVTGYSALSVSLQWTDEEIDLTQPGMVGFDFNRSHFVNVYRSTDNFVFNDELVGTVNNAQTQFPYLASSDVLVFTDNTAQPGTLYYYRVRGESTVYAPGNYSGVVSQTTNPIVYEDVADALVPATMASDVTTPSIALTLLDSSDSPFQSMDAGDTQQVGKLIGDVGWSCVGQTLPGATNPNFYRTDFMTNVVTPITMSARMFAHDGTDLWVASRNGPLKRLNPTTLAETASIGSSLATVYWDGSDLWTMKTNGVVQKVNRTLLTFTDLGPGTDTTSAAYGIVKIGSFIYALTNVTASSVKITKITPATPAISATYTLGIPAAGNIYTDGTFLYIQSSSRLALWKINPSTGAVVEVRDTGQVTGAFALTPSSDGVYASYWKVPFSGGFHYKASAGLAISNSETVIGNDGTNVMLAKQTFGSPNSQSFEMFTRYAKASLEVDLGNSPVAFSAPAAPTSLLATPVGETVQLSWTDANSNYDVIRIERSANAGPFVALSTQAPSPATFTDSTPPGNSAALIYRVYAVNAGAESFASVSITSPVTDQTFQIGEVGTTHVSYASVGTDLWAAYDASGTVYAAKIDSSLIRTDFVLQVGNTGGAVKRLLSDGTYIYVVTAGNPIKVRKYDLTGAFVGPEFSIAGTTLDACIGSGFIWFLFGTQIKKLTTSDMTTVTTISPAVGFGSLGSIIYNATNVAIYANEDVQGSSNRKTYRYDTSDALIDSATTDGGKFRAASGVYTPFSRPTMYATCIDQTSGSSRVPFGYNLNSLGSRYLLGSVEAINWSGITFDFANEKVYMIVAGSPGTIRRLSNTLSVGDSRSKNVAPTQDDEVIRVNGRVFVTITDVGAGSGFSILSLVF